MLDDIVVNIQEQTLDISARGTITGKICLATHVACFPENNWNDFPVVLLTWWLQAIAIPASSSGNQYEFRFMDGPFLAHGTMITEDQMSMEFLDRRKTQSVVFSATVSLKALRDSIVAAAERVLDIATLRFWDSAEILELRRLLMQIQS